MVGGPVVDEAELGVGELPRPNEDDVPIESPGLLGGPDWDGTPDDGDGCDAAWDAPREPLGANPDVVSESALEEDDATDELEAYGRSLEEGDVGRLSKPVEMVGESTVSVTDGWLLTLG